MIQSPHIAYREFSGLHAPIRYSTEQEYCTVLYWAIVANRLRRMLEIGTHLGYSTWWWVEAAKQIGGYLVTIDIKSPPPLKYDAKYFSQVESSSDAFFESLSQDMKFDFVYVDGWHGYDQAYKDIVNSANHLSPGGVIAVHDTATNEGEALQVLRALEDAIPIIGGNWFHLSQGKGLSIGEF